MNFIIDANNLAGRLGILKENDFDQKLIDIIRGWLGEKKKLVVLVFDSLEPMGNRLSYGNLEVIYSPRDRYYKTADDKIIELFQQWSFAGDKRSKNDRVEISIIQRLQKDDLIFVSDDLDLREKVMDIKYDISEKIRLMRNDEFMAMLKKGYPVATSDEEEDEDNRGLSDDEMDDITEEMMGKWGG